jgi:hypothetical protein
MTWRASATRESKMDVFMTEFGITKQTTEKTDEGIVVGRIEDSQMEWNGRRRKNTNGYLPNLGAETSP